MSRLIDSAYPDVVTVVDRRVRVYEAGIQKPWVDHVGGFLHAADVQEVLTGASVRSAREVYLYDDYSLTGSEHWWGILVEYMKPCDTYVIDGSLWVGFFQNSDKAIAYLGYVRMVYALT